MPKIGSPFRLIGARARKVFCMCAFTAQAVMSRSCRRINFEIVAAIKARKDKTVAQAAKTNPRGLPPEHNVAASINRDAWFYHRVLRQGWAARRGGTGRRDGQFEIWNTETVDCPADRRSGRQSRSGNRAWSMMSPTVEVMEVAAPGLRRRNALKSEPTPPPTTSLFCSRRRSRCLRPRRGSCLWTERSAAAATRKPF